MAGAAAALTGSLQYGSGILSTLLLARFGDGTPWPMTWIIAASVVLSAVVASGGRTPVAHVYGPDTWVTHVRRHG